MSDMGSMNRENKKRQLRNNIVQLPRPDQRRPRNDEEDSEEVIRQVHVTRRNRRLFVFAVAAIFIGVLGFSWYKYQHEYEFTSYDVSWEKSMRYVDEASEDEEGGAKSVGESSFVNFVSFGDNMIKYSKDGASYIDAGGKTIWTLSYEMKTPVVSINGDFIAIADQQGNDIYICNKDGSTGTAKTQLPITKAAVSAKGVVAAVVEDSSAAYIYYFKKDGSNLGIDVKMLLSGDGYPVDMALSPDGKQVALSVMYMKNGALKNKIVFYDFSEIGKNVNNRFVGGFEEEFDDKMVARIRYLNSDTVCAFSDKGLTFISVKNVIPDTNVITVPVEEEIEAVCYSDQYAGVVVDNPSGNPYRMDVYKTDGSLAGSIDFDYLYSGVQIDGDKVILYNEESCRVYNLAGHLKFEGRFDFTVSHVRAGKSHMNSLVVAGSEVMKEIKLK